MQNSIQILCTRPLHEALLSETKQAGINITVLPFIETAPIQTIPVLQEIKQAFIQNATVVFTSMNAVETVAVHLGDHRPVWEIFCIGTTTKKLVGKHFGEETIAGTANDAASLAELISADQFRKSVIFFCGKRRREELPGILRSHSIAVNEVIVYETIAVSHAISEAYDGILFFSPSAVESFFHNNQVPSATILFAIGNTTANEIKKYTGNKIITSEEPGMEALVRKMTAWFR